MSLARRMQLRWSFRRNHEVSASPAKTLVVFDFDCTLAARHMYSSLRSGAGMAQMRQDPHTFYEDIFGGCQRLHDLNIFLGHLKDAGATVYILSHGLEAEIIPALSSTGLAGFFSR